MSSARSVVCCAVAVCVAGVSGAGCAAGPRHRSTRPPWKGNPNGGVDRFVKDGSRSRRPNLVCKDDAAIPNFPEPIPLPSARMALPRTLIDVPATGAATLGDVANALDGLMLRAGYSQRSYFELVTDDEAEGFAIVTRMERIRRDGAPFPPEQRFTAAGAPDQFDVVSFLSSLFVAPVGYYRVIVLLVSRREVRSSDRPMAEEQADQLLDEGESRLRGCVARMGYDETYDLTAAIYEFRHAPEQAAEKDEAVQQLKPGLLDPVLHLRKAGLLPNPR